MRGLFPIVFIENGNLRLDLQALVYRKFSMLHVKYPILQLVILSNTLQTDGVAWARWESRKVQL